MDSDIKFEFTTDFQWDLLKFSVLDSSGYKVIPYYEDSYFTDFFHSVISFGIKSFYKKNNLVPSKSLLKEELINVVFRSKDFITSLLPDDRDHIMELVDNLYSSPVKNADIILDRAMRFASFVQLKELVEGIDLLNFNTYTKFSTDVQKAINIPQVIHKKGTFLISNVSDRQAERKTNSNIVPTPFRQINALTNAGGYPKGGIIVILDKPKQLKTAMLVNVVRGYLRMKKPVLVIDFENGEDEWAIRLEQSIGKLDKISILSGDGDKKIKSMLRRYGRLGSECYIRRLPASSTTHDIQGLMDELYRDFGFKPQILAIDYIGLMRSISNRDDDFGRISDAYIDVANLALKNDISHVWTPHHVVRAAGKREKSKYRDEDIAKCIDIVRHAQAIYGLNRNDYEKDTNIVRMELVVQRDGIPTGRGLFHVDATTQRVDEFTRVEIKDYYENVDIGMDEELSERDTEIPKNIKGDRNRHGDEVQ